MSFANMKQSLVNAYEKHVQVVRSIQRGEDDRTSVGGTPEKVTISLLSGPTGIGKTACIREFAKQNGFKLVELDCSYMPSSFLATFMYANIGQILDGDSAGCVIGIDNIDQADSEWLELFHQYSDNYFDAEVNVAKDQASEISKERKQFAKIPESLFIVGVTDNDGQS